MRPPTFELPPKLTVRDLIAALGRFPADLDVEVGFDGDQGTTVPYEVTIRERPGSEPTVRLVGF